MREVRVRTRYNPSDRYSKVFFKAHYVYESLEEAREAGIVFVPWREASHKGQWVSSDDGFVGEVRSIRVLPEKRKWRRDRGLRQDYKEIRTTFGRAFSGQRKQFKAFDPDALKWTQKLYRRAQFKAMVSLYVSMLFHGRKIDYVRLTRVLWQNNTYSVRFVKHYLRKEEVQDMIRAELDRQLEASGFAFKDILAEYKELIIACKKEKDLQNLRLTLEKFIELHDALPAKRSMNFSMSSQGTLTGGPVPEEPHLLSPADEEEAKEEMEKVLEKRRLELTQEQAPAEVIE